MGGGDGVAGNGAPFPAAHLFPLSHTAEPPTTTMRFYSFTSLFISERICLSEASTS
ncbi:MAG: hypothetical protein K5882_02830 [Bacteroidales bacterium]|nr:hypothetical protein [Bacteroidales bacterium]